MKFNFKKALTFFQKDHLNEAKNLCIEALKEEPNNFDFLHLYGVISFREKDYEKSEQLISKAIRLKPNFEIYDFYAFILFNLGKFDLAIESLDEVIRLKPDYAEAHNNRANMLFKLGKVEASLKSYNAAIKLNPYNSQAYNNLGILLGKLDKKNSALESYERAIKIKPDYAEAHYNKGNILLELNKNNTALDSYKKALETKTYIKTLLGTIVHAKLKMCDWTNLNKDLKNFKDEITDPKKMPNPFHLLSVFDSPEIQKTAAEKWFINKYNSLNNSLEKISKRKKNKKIKIGYYSADFREHAVGQLIVNLFELHNKSNFEIFGFYFGPDINDYTNKRISKAVDKFINVRLKSETEIARLSRNLQIDIAVDLMGHTERSRFEIFAERCAPIQVSYLGYAGTLGANCIDYLIADKTLIPKENQKYYSEKIIYLPNTYLVNDSTKKISEKIFKRDDLDLPKNSFIFCCFNQSHKILPETFNSWMKILKKVSGSVLWLFETNEISSKNLKQEAIKAGIDANRIIFAKRLIKLEEHLARYKVADLFLDTFPYTAHSTCADSLKAGLPVLTLQGQSFASRVSSSLLEVVNLKELITHSSNEYENMAVELANNLSKLKNIKKKLEDSKNKTPLFNTKLFTNHIEKAYILMFEKYIKGEENNNIEV